MIEEPHDVSSSIFPSKAASSQGRGQSYSCLKLSAKSDTEDGLTAAAMLPVSNRVLTFTVSRLNPF